MPYIGLSGTAPAKAYGWGSFSVSGSYDSIASTLLGSNATSVTFSSIPSTYTHLEIRCFTRFAGNDGGYGMMFNNDTNTGNYYSHTVAGSGTSGYAQNWNQTFVAWTISNNSYTSNLFTPTIITIYDYLNTNRKTTSRTLWGFADNGSGRIGVGSHMWDNTAAVSTIRLDSRILGSTSDFAAGSRFSLYGIKGS